MKKIERKTIIIVVLSLIFGLLAGWLIFGGREHSQNEHKEHTQEEAIGETTWTCSMHPQIRQKEPGDCPICGMDLIPIEEDEDSDTDGLSITMSPTAMQLASVSTAIVGKTVPFKDVRLNGKVQADERNVFSQVSHISGRIEKLLVNFTGEFVNRGQTIAYIYSPELVTAQNELFEAKKLKGTHPQIFNASREKLKNWKITDSQIDAIIQSGKIQSEFPINADVSGYISAKNVNVGDYISQGQMLYEITDLSKVWILLDIYENDISWISKNDKVQFAVASFPGEEFNGTISFIDPVINYSTRTAKARVEFSNPNGKLKPEMFVSGIVKSKLNKQADAIIVPKTAVLWTGKRSIIYITTRDEDKMKFTMREITLGPSLGDSYIVKEGLAEGEEIVINGTFSVDAASQLSGKPSMMNPDGGVVTTGHEHHQGDSPTISEEKSISKISKISNEAKTKLNPLFNQYLAWKNALVQDNLSESQKSAEMMLNELNKINLGLFEGEAHNKMVKFHSALQNNMPHVTHLNNIEKVRDVFRHVSINMIEITNTFKPFTKTLYVQHCPMADDNKGADWLSTEQEIRNPYFGSSMLKCGEIIQTIESGN